MAAEGPVQELCEEVSCSVCLELFRDPVTLAECGHSFCRACLTRGWGESGASEPSCPQCRGKTQEGSLRPNHQLAKIVEIAKKFSPGEGEGAEAEGGEGEGGVCEKHGEPLKFLCREDEAPLCVVCSRSREHRGHQVGPLEKEEEAAGEKKKAARKESVCQKHRQPLKLFCKDDEAPICVVCEQSREHQYHDVVPVEEASQEYKDQFCTCLEILQKERKKILAHKDNLAKESQDLLRQTKGERQKMLTKFRQLHVFLEEEEKLLLAQMEDVEKEVARNRDRHLSRLSEELSSLESLIQEMEKTQQPAIDLLQEARRTLQRYEEKAPFENPVALPLALKWRIWGFSDLSPFLEGIKKQLKDTLDSGPYQKANVTLDPDTAHPRLLLSEGQKSVSEGEKTQALPDNPERFDKWGIVLGREGFTRGRHFWEVLVGTEGDWAVGVARKSVRRKGFFTFSPEEGFWAVGKWAGKYRAHIKKHHPPLTLTGELKRIRVCLNCAGGRVAFFNADREALLYEFSGASFPGETLLPFFWVDEKGPLTISS